MPQILAIVVHVVAAVVWVGGMFFAFMVLRPAAGNLLEPPQRLPLWAKVFSTFFPWVWLAIFLLLSSGYWMIFNVFGGMATSPLYVHVMTGLGIVMMLIFAHVFFAPYRRLTQAVVTEDWAKGAAALGQIRILVAINLILGMLVLVIASAGRYLVV